ncbi:putative ABC transporter ATP-binding protein YxlF [Rubripirellula tenax]|uniref:Putative ABC transporter ATP-binding protein YxlF n=1 Tax=Rubripirellula tenax TaxID=2528015 RepID=A0A5C6FIM3_9BACT|nr:ABC transporter ATP-binding protein [Rubripirellula tenax]TWU59927.1 putative ABC transporter ATP-binding protein YxlF [Rubripirellula tenax]
MNQTSTPLLELNHLSYHYGKQVAVDSLDLQVAEGSFFGLLGPNGAGKTTSIQCIAGLLSQWSGKMMFRGEPFQPAENVEHRKRIGFVPQDLAIYDDLTAMENLDFFGRLAGLAGAELTAQVDRALELAGLESRAKDRTGAFSGGMKRRLNLAIGQLHQPELLLLDEPTAGVDPQSRAHLFDALTRLNESGMTIVYTTHYMEEAERLCDPIAIMNAGKVIGLGSAKQLAEDVGDPNADLETVFLSLTGRSLRDE